MQPFSGALREIATIPGARYSCIADGETGDVLAERGPPGPDPAAALRWGAVLRAVLRSSGELEDVMITAGTTYHLLRPVRSGSRSLLVGVCLDRTRGNLALARRALVGAQSALRPEIPEQAPPPATEHPTTGLPLRIPMQALPESRPLVPGRAAGAPPSAVAPPRNPAPLFGPPTDRTAVRARPAPTSGSTTTDGPPAIPAARGWSDDLHTLRRLLDALRRLP